MTCVNCGDEIHDVDTRWAFDEPYCEDCFSDCFNYCSRCDTVISRDNTHYSDDGDPYCSECWDEDYDDDAPKNPDVYEEDRELIVKLSRSWLEGKNIYHKLIYINDKDFHLQNIRNKVGLTQNPIYVFGLIDREDYQLSASQNIYDDVRQFALLHFPDVKITQGIGTNRLGVSLSLRASYQKEIIELIQQITSVEETAPAVNE